MPKLVKLGSSMPDLWTVIEADAVPAAADIPDYALLPLTAYCELADQLSDKHGVWLNSDDDIAALENHIGTLPVIACRFTNFMDGRSFTQGRALREHYEFQGALRALGSFIQDQMFFLLRCGFSEFSVADDANDEELQQSLRDFSESYQAARDVTQPLFRRRA